MGQNRSRNRAHQKAKSELSTPKPAKFFRSVAELDFYSEIVSELRKILGSIRLKGMKFGTDAASMHTFLQNRSSWSFEPHFSLQKEACAFQTSWGYWNKILIYDDNEQSAELTSKMFDNRIDFPILHGWGGDGAIWSKRTSHSTANSEQKRILLKNTCGSQTLWAELLSYLQPDYDFFNFAPPRLCENYNPE